MAWLCVFRRTSENPDRGRRDRREGKSRNRGHQKGRHQGDGEVTALASSPAALVLTSSLPVLFGCRTSAGSGAKGHRPGPPIPACHEEGAVSETHPVSNLLPNPREEPQEHSHFPQCDAPQRVSRVSIWYSGEGEGHDKGQGSPPKGAYGSFQHSKEGNKNLPKDPPNDLFQVFAPLPGTRSQRDENPKGGRLLAHCASMLGPGPSPQGPSRIPRANPIPSALPQPYPSTP